MHYIRGVPMEPEDCHYRLEKFQGKRSRGYIGPWFDTRNEAHGQMIHKYLGPASREGCTLKVVRRPGRL